MTYSILLIIKKPDLSVVDNKKLWEACVNKIKSLAIQNTELELLTESALLLPLGDNLSVLAAAILATDRLEYNYLILTEETKLQSVLSRV